MTERFMVDDAGTLIDMHTRDIFDIVEEVCPLLNELHEENQELKRLVKVTVEDYTDLEQSFDLIDKENEQLQTKNNAYIQDIEVFKEENTHLKLENEELKEDNNAFIHLLENQSIIIQELHSKLLEYQVKEPIALTKEDLELMGKAISYYTHGRCGE